LVSQPI